MDRETPDMDKFMSEELKDFFGQDIRVGDRLAKPDKYTYTSAAMIFMVTVTEISNNRIYLDNSKVPIKYPARCINISALRDGRY